MNGELAPPLLKNLGFKFNLKVLIALLAMVIFTFGCTKKKKDEETASAAPPAEETSVPPPIVEDPTPLSIPIVTSPSANSTTSNSQSLTVNGICLDGATVYISGDDTQSVPCSGAMFNASIAEEVDGTFAYNIYQQSNSLNASLSYALTWTRDTTLPTAPTITSHSSNFYSGANSVTLSGTCEDNSNVVVSGAESISATCSSSAYSITLSNSSDGTYSYTVKQIDLAGNNSTSNPTFTWIRDTNAPSAPTITLPVSSPHYSNSDSLTLSGACESGTTVKLTGSTTDTVTCSSSSYSFNISKTNDSTYSFSLLQTDLAGNDSPSSSTSWIRDTVAPGAPSITSPSSPYTSADTTFNIVGSCETGATLNLSGAASGTASCLGGTFSIEINKSSDQTYDYSLTQTDVSGNNSPPSDFQWMRNSSIPATPVFSSPSLNPYYSKIDSLVLTGSCNTGFTVELSGDDTQSTVCASSEFTFSINKTSDQTYSFSVKQKNLSNIYSAAASIQWIRDTVNPNPPVVIVPTSTPLTSNGNSITISGSCETNSTVDLIGDSTQSITCAASTFSFNVSKSTDGQFNFNVLQTDQAGNSSTAASIAWIRDTVAPATPTITNPAASPFVSNNASISIVGSCETGNIVYVQKYTSSERTTASGSPVSGACSGAGAYSIAVSASLDETYYYSVYQKDGANNSSSSINQDWQKDSSLMATPAVTYNSVIVTEPIISNSSSIAVSVSCTQGTGNVIYILGDVTSGDVSEGLSQTCDSVSSRTFTITKSTDGTFNLSFYQDNQTNATISATTSLQWTRDTSIPLAPTITTPSSSPFTAPGSLTLAGSCEINATLNISGDFIDSQLCSSGTYSFLISKYTDLTYNFSVTQTDGAGNISNATTLVWIRDSNSVPPPTISSPASSPTRNNQTSLTISGTCNSGYLLTLAGDVIASDVTTPSSSLTQNCNGGFFSYVVSKASSSDQTFNFVLKQTFNSVDSSVATVSWIKDTAAPTITISAQPPATNLQKSATFSFSTDETATFQCKLDSGTYATCTSPYSNASLSNGSHSFTLKATDQAGNEQISTPINWSQAAYSAIAIYHLDNASPTTDSGNYTQVAGYVNTLTATGTPVNDATGRFSESRDISAANYYSSASNDSMNVIRTAITVEGFFQSFAWSNSTYYSLVSKGGTSSGTFGWEVRVNKASGNGNSTKCKLQLLLTISNTTTPTILNSPSTFNCSENTTAWQYFAVSWSASTGTAKFYASSAYNALTTLKNLGTASFGNSTSSLASNTIALKIGGVGYTGGTAFPGGIDEVRISQLERPITAVPSVMFSAD